MRDSFTATTVEIAGAAERTIEAYQVTRDGCDPVGSIVLVHHLLGFDRSSREMARRVAELGYNVICPNLYSGDPWGPIPAGAPALAQAGAKVGDARVIGDLDCSRRYLLDQPTSNGRIGIMGVSSGGRYAILAACRMTIHAVVDCYGPFVTTDSPPGHPLRVAGVAAELTMLGSPVLGIFGDLDQAPSPADVQDLEIRLRRLAVPHEFFGHDDAGHAFLANDRPTYRVEAANEAWRRVESFLGRHLAVIDDS